MSRENRRPNRSALGRARAYLKRNGQIVAIRVPYGGGKSHLAYMLAKHEHVLPADSAQTIAYFRSEKDDQFVLIDLPDDVVQAIAHKGGVLPNGDVIAQHGPPQRAELLLRYVLPFERQSELLGDLAERHADICDRYGRQEADRWYRWQACRSCGPLLRVWVVRLMSLQWLWELLRRAIG
jgi:hypothetical protein